MMRDLRSRLPRFRQLWFASALALLFGMAGHRAAAQPHRVFTALEYSMAYPIGDTHHYVPRWSWSGAAFEGRWMDHPHTSIGALIGFNEFSRRSSGTFYFPNAAVTGDQYHHLLMVPLLFTAHWYFNTNANNPRWYAGAGGGFQYAEQELEIGTEDHKHSQWNMLLVPEVGYTFPAWQGTGGIVALRYHLPSRADDFLGSDRRRFQYVSLSVGFGYR